MTQFNVVFFTREQAALGTVGRLLQGIAAWELGAVATPAMPRSQLGQRLSFMTKIQILIVADFGTPRLNARGGIRHGRTQRKRAVRSA